MRRLVRLVRRAPLVAATLAVGAVTLTLLALGLATPAAVVASAYALVIAVRELVGMIRALRHGRLGLDLLALLAIVSTVLVGEYLAALVVVLMLTSGEALEAAAATRARRELRALLERVPPAAHRREGSEILDVPLDAVRLGDRLLVRPGEVVPVDGRLESAAAFDESALTGESLPVERDAGEVVPSGAVNGSRAVGIEVVAVAAESRYQRVVALVREAAESRAPLVRLADRFALPFTGLALVLAALGWVLSGDPHRAAEVLVVATPCPLLIAAPVAFLAGTGRAAAAGIVVKSAALVEVLARVRTAAFDKTGTLTEGRPVLTAVEPEPGFSESELLGLVASAELSSGHVLASAVVDAARERGVRVETPESAREEATHGVRARVGGHEVLVGKPGFLESARVAGMRRIDPRAGDAVVYAAVDGRFAGVLRLRDRIRPETAATLAALEHLGVERTVVISGDVDGTARELAAQAGVDEVYPECSPEDKVRLVAGLAPRPVLMVGDGINDAPVLAAAEIGIAMGARGATAASESATVVLLVDDLAAVARAIAIGRRTVRVALQSIGGGIAISVALMLVALTGALPAIAGAGLQELVDLVAILAALRALRPGREERRLLPEAPPRVPREVGAPAATGR
ncbi:MAG: cadmium-translocating P-type ATPase [Actinomycetales bacterium]|nr:cadmium-translocating P-type ATPase [Actinomycetales bacterium]